MTGSWVPFSSNYLGKFTGNLQRTVCVRMCMWRTILRIFLCSFKPVLIFVYSMLEIKLQFLFFWYIILFVLLVSKRTNVRIHKNSRVIMQVFEFLRTLNLLATHWNNQILRLSVMEIGLFSLLLPVIHTFEQNSSSKLSKQNQAKRMSWPRHSSISRIWWVNVDDFNEQLLTSLASREWDERRTSCNVQRYCEWLPDSSCLPKLVCLFGFSIWTATDIVICHSANASIIKYNIKSYSIFKCFHSFELIFAFIFVIPEWLLCELFRFSLQIFIERMAKTCEPILILSCVDNKYKRKTNKTRAHPKYKQICIQLHIRNRIDVASSIK